MSSVWYIGSADVRRISSAEWTAAGVSGLPATSQWDETNGWSLDAALFNSAQLVILDADDNFFVGAPDGANPSKVPGEVDGATTQYATEAYVNARTLAGLSGGYVYTQAAPAGTWTIPHTLGRSPIVQLFDPTLHVMDSDIVSGSSTVTVTFAVPTAGSAVLT